MTTPAKSLPFSRPLAREYQLSLVIALLMTAASLAGLLAPHSLYPSAELRRGFVTNDVVNVALGLPLLLGALALARRGTLLGLLFWPGALFYVTYNYIAYSVAMPLTWQFVLYLALVGLSAYAIVRLLKSIDGAAVQARLQDRVAERFGAGVLMGFGILFFLRAVAEFFDGAAGMLDFGVLVADGLITPLWILGGLYLWRKQPLGYVAGAGLLFQAGMLFVALLVFFVLQPFVAAVPFPAEDFVVIFVMGFVCFVPFGLFVRGILKGS